MKKALLFMVILALFTAGPLLAQDIKWTTWTACPWGEYIVSSSNENVMIFSSWDELTDASDQVFNWMRGDFKKGAPSIAKKLVTKLMDTPGVVNVLVAKHRMEIFRARVYTWDILFPEIEAILKTSELKTTPLAKAEKKE